MGLTLLTSFNSRARVGRDGFGGCLRLLTRRFNSRARVGRDWVGSKVDSYVAVSIHAPAWGATTRWAVNSRTANLFQFTRPRGARPV